MFVGPVLRAMLFAIAIAAMGFTLWFFRDPERTTPDGAVGGDMILAPADGKVVLVEEVQDSLYLKGPAKQVSIFLSPLNVHVNRNPVDGVVEYDEYVPGDYLVARSAEHTSERRVGEE